MKSFSSKKYLKVHETKIHTANKNKYDHCDFSDRDKIKLREHMKTTHEENTSAHVMDTATTQDGTKKNKCDYCDFSDHDKIKLREHMKTSHEENVSTHVMDTAATQDGSNSDSLDGLAKVSWEKKDG